MPAYQRRQQTIFSTVKNEGAILPFDLLQRIRDPQNAQLAGLTPQDYHLVDLRLHEAINQAWTRLLGLWQRFQNERAKLSPSENGTRLTRERLLIPLFKALDYGQIQPAKALAINERSYAISHKWGDHTPIHLVSYKVELDKSVQREKGSPRTSPHSLLQGLLNHSPEHLWGMVSNGLRLRILRNNVGLTGQAYLEFDLEEIFDNQVYADFVLLWLLCHQSRVEVKERPHECWLEKWAREGHATGVRVREDLRKNVEAAISDLGSGFLSHPANGPLREKLRSGSLSAMDYYNQVLRLVYRLLILFVAEDRDILFDPDALDHAKDIYRKHYSTANLRMLADRHLGTRHSDLYYGLKLVMEKLGEKEGCPELGLPGLNGFLFSPEALIDLKDCQLANYALLAAIRHLAYTESGRKWRIIDYKNLGSEELGSVYESLLELHPLFHLDTGKFELASASGNVRKTTGSYYTPTSLITCLLDSALDPVLNEAADKATPAEAEAAILNLKICDPACGSGHFLVAAAHRIAKKLATVRTGDEEPSIADHRHALREVVGHCIYGVDINPMAVELCKVNLWMEAIEPGKPLSFLDAHVQCGNSLLGATPRLLKNGIPDSAFEPIEGDDKQICTEFKKYNKKLREGNVSLLREDQEVPIWEQQGTLVHAIYQLNNLPDDSVADVREKDRLFKQIRQSEAYKNAKLWADAWCAAFVWKKTAEMRPPITDEEFHSIGKNPFTLAPWRKAEIERLAAQYQFFHWHLAFLDIFQIPANFEDAENEQTGWSGGFDVVLGNPPWERIKIQEKEWFAAKRPDIANAPNAATRRRMLAELIHEDSKLYNAFREDIRAAEGESLLIRRSGRYPLCGHGDVNSYSVFAEHVRAVMNARSKAGYIVPSGIATDDTTKLFFQDLMEQQALASLYTFENREKFFPDVDGRYTFSLLTMLGSKRPATQGTNFIFFAQQVGDEHDDHRRFTLNANDISLLTPNTRTCPIFRTRRDITLAKMIYERVPVLIKDGPSEENPWNMKFTRMFDMTNDAPLFCTREQLEADGWDLEGNIFHKNGKRWMPIFEGKMTGMYNHRSASIEIHAENALRQQQPRLSSEKDRQNPHFATIPYLWCSEEEGYKRTPKMWHHTWFPVIKQITSSTNERTLIGTIIPWTTASYTLYIMTCNPAYQELILCLFACMNSFMGDYILRQKHAKPSLPMGVVYECAFLPPSTFMKQTPWDQILLNLWITQRVLELTYTAWDLEAFAKDCGYAGPPFRWDEQRRFLLRCELDAAYFHLYGIGREDVEYIMETFPIVKREDEKLHGEYRTKRVILEIYDEMARAMETGGTYATRLVPGPADPTVAHKR